jgi:alpha-N-arabinofuranosidase
MTENNGACWKQTIFYPFLYASLYGNGKTLKTRVQVESYTTSKGQEIPYIYTSVIENEDSVVVFAVNRNLEEDLSLDIEGLDNLVLDSHVELYCNDLNSINDKDNQRITPNNVKISDSIILKKHSWNMLIFKK